MTAEITLARKGMSSRANCRSTTAGSSSPVSDSSRWIDGGSSMLPVSIASKKSACFDFTWRSSAAGVTFSSPAMSASVAASKPFRAKTLRAVASSWGRWMVAGRPICK